MRVLAPMSCTWTQCAKYILTMNSSWGRGPITRVQVSGISSRCISSNCLRHIETRRGKDCSSRTTSHMISLFTICSSLAVSTITLEQ
jgi:Na+(H+)/acetate symporter ActP